MRWGRLEARLDFRIASNSRASDPSFAHFQVVWPGNGLKQNLQEPHILRIIINNQYPKHHNPPGHLISATAMEMPRVRTSEAPQEDRAPEYNSPPPEFCATLHNRHLAAGLAVRKRTLEQWLSALIGERDEVAVKCIRPTYCHKVPAIIVVESGASNDWRR